MKCLLLLAVLVAGMWLMARMPEGAEDGAAAAEASPEACRQLLDAATRGDIDAVRRLLGEGVPVGCRDECGNDALLIAAIGGHTDVVKLLLAAGASIESKTRFNATPLMIACLFGKDRTADELLRQGADVNVHTRLGVTPLMIAATRGDPDLINHLLAAGADPLLRDRRGQCASDYLDADADSSCIHALASAFQASCE
jgi:ankyrin repeat protein